MLTIDDVIPTYVIPHLSLNRARVCWDDTEHKDTEHMDTEHRAHGHEAERARRSERG
jgi:hypothetical protein